MKKKTTKKQKKGKKLVRKTKTVIRKKRKKRSNEQRRKREKEIATSGIKRNSIKRKSKKKREDRKNKKNKNKKATTSSRHLPIRDLKWFQKNIAIKIIGIGGAGCNIISRMKEKGIAGVEFIAINTDIQDLNHSKADKKIQIGKVACRGLGAGTDPDKGREAAQENIEDINQVVQGADLIFITCGLGGGTGSGASPIVANLAKQTGALVVAFVTKPFTFEGEKRQEVAETAWQNLFNEVDAILTIPNDRIFNIIEENTSILEAFAKVDEVLRQGVKGIVDLIVYPGLINLDFANIKTILANAGITLMGIGKARGVDRAKKAAQKAINSPLLDISIEGAKRVLFNIAGKKDMTLTEVHTASQIITQAVSKDAQVIFGASYDKDLKEGEIKITVIAGFASEEFQEFEPKLPLVTRVSEEAPLKTEKEKKTIKVETEEEEKPLRQASEQEDELEIPAFLRRRKKKI